MNCTHCDRAAVVHGLCDLHRKRWERDQPLDAPVRATRGDSVQTSVRSSTEQKQAWQRAAKRAKQAFRDWIRTTLDKAAER